MGSQMDGAEAHEGSLKYLHLETFRSIVDYSEFQGVGEWLTTRR